MKLFTVYKSSFDGICSGGRISIQDASESICVSKGWDSLSQLKEKILEWGNIARPGDTFATYHSVIVCVRSNPETTYECPECLSDDILFSDFIVDVPDEEEILIKQEGKCNSCGKKWCEVWSHSETEERESSDS